MAVTIKDIARESGYSITAVSMALSNKPNRLSLKTKETIRSVATLLHYQPNQAAAYLASNKSSLIGIIASNSQNSYVSETIMTVGIELRKRGYSMVCDISDNDFSYSIAECAKLINCGVSGIIVCLPETVLKNTDIERLIEYLSQENIPVVFRNFRDVPQSPLISVIKTDFEIAGYLATKHLLDLGHVQIGCATGPIELQATVDKMNGHKRALQEAGIHYVEQYSYIGKDYSIECGSQSLAPLLGQKVTAIFAFNDQIAFGIYRSARNYRLKIPETLSVIGIDDVSLNDILHTPLTSVSIDIPSISKAMVLDIVDLIEKRQIDPDQSRTFTPHLMIRGSTSSV